MSLTRTSPGVTVREIDLTQFIPNTGVSGGAFVGDFIWGAAYDYTNVSDTNEIVSLLGKPTDRNYVDWYSVSNFLAYTNACTVVRVIDETTAKNATADGLGLLVKNQQHFHTIQGTNQTAQFVAKWAGNLGNTLKVSIADSATFDSWLYKSDFDFAPSSSDYALAKGSSNDELHLIVIDEDGLFSGTPGAILEKYSFLSKALDTTDLDGRPSFYGNVINKQSNYIRYLGSPTGTELTTNLKVSSVDITDGGVGYTTASIVFLNAPMGGVTATADVEITAGVITNIIITNPGSGYITEPTFTLTGDGSTPAVLGTVNMIEDTSDDWEQTCLDENGVARQYASLSGQYTKSLSGGSNGDIPSAANYMTGWDLMKNKEDIDVSLLFIGHAGGVANSTILIQYVIDNIVHKRLDCMLFISPDLDDVLNKENSICTYNVVTKKSTIARSSSYVSMDSGWKLQMDVYAQKLRWMPLNPDIAGLCAQVDQNSDTWWSPAGYTRGNIKNVYKLAFNPAEANRDELYKNNINPVITSTTDGTILFGDKTLQAKSSAFSYINVRRLFLLLEKAISRASKYTLFEFNDAFTRQSFKSMITPYLRTVQGRRGVQDFYVVCDETNNTPEVIDRAEFKAAIFIKPNRSINFIELSFIAVPTGVSFNEKIVVAQ